MNIIQFSALVLALALHRDKMVDPSWAAGVANDQWQSAAKEADQRDPMMCGPEATAGIALALLAVAQHESGLWRSVQDCSVCVPGQWCDNGRSISLYQLHVGSGAWGDFPREAICSDNRLATDLALRVLRRHRKASDPAHLFIGYARGGLRKAGPEMAAIFTGLLLKTGIVVKYVDGCLHASTPDKR